MNTVINGLCFLFGSSLQVGLNSVPHVSLVEKNVLSSTCSYFFFALCLRAGSFLFGIVLVIHFTREHREFPDNGQFVGMAVFWLNIGKLFSPWGFYTPPPRLLLQEEVSQLNAADDRRRRRLRLMCSNHLGVEYGF